MFFMFRSIILQSYGALVWDGASKEKISFYSKFYVFFMVPQIFYIISVFHFILLLLL